MNNFVHTLMYPETRGSAYSIQHDEFKFPKINLYQHSTQTVIPDAFNPCISFLSDSDICCLLTTWFFERLYYKLWQCSF